jgi:hypothetical protein
MSTGIRDCRVKLYDGSKHVLDFVRRFYLEDGTYDEWSVAVKPASNKVMMHPNRPRPGDTHSPDQFVERLPDGRRMLKNVPGIRRVLFDELSSILDTLVTLRGDEHKLTVGELRQCLRH